MSKKEDDRQARAMVAFFKRYGQTDPGPAVNGIITPAHRNVGKLLNYFLPFGAPDLSDKEAIAWIDEMICKDDWKDRQRANAAIDHIADAKSKAELDAALAAFMQLESINGWADDEHLQKLRALKIGDYENIPAKCPINNFNVHSR